MKHRWIVCLLLLVGLPSTWALDHDPDDILLPDTLNTVWQMKYEPLAKNHAYAVSHISPDALCLNGNSFLTNALYGVIPGALIQNTSFQPGMPPSIHIRGNHSPGMDPLIVYSYRNLGLAANTPVYLLDGMQVDAQWFGGLNPDEIESVEVIRNLAGTIGYGQPRINGVIQVKTKRQQKRGTSLVYNGYWGLQKPTNVVRPMNGAEWAEYIREAYRNTEPQLYNAPMPSLNEDMNISDFTSNQDIWESLQMGYDNSGTYYPEKVRSTDWTDLVSQTGSIHEQTLSLLYGTEKLRVTAAGNYFSNKGTLKETGYDRYSARILVEGDITRWLSAGAQVWGSYAEQKLKSNMYYEAFRMNPLAVPYNKNGTLAVFENHVLNPLSYLNDYHEKTSSNMLSGRLYVALQPLNGLNIRAAYLPQVTNAGEQIDNLRNFYYNSTLKYSDNTAIDNTHNISVWEFSVSWQKKLQQHLLGGSLSGNFKKDKTIVDRSEIIMYNDTPISANGLDLETGTKYKYYFGEFFYKWNNQLSVNVLTRIGKEELDVNNKKPSGFNPAISAAYYFIGTEGRSNQILNQLDLRAGYGKDNNIQLISTLVPYPTSLDWINVPIKNEYSEWNIGLDHAWFQNRLKGSIDYYIRKNHVLRLGFFDNSSFDYLDLKNSGIEISLSSTNIHTGHWIWISSLMLSIEKEKAQLLNNYFYIDNIIVNGCPLYSYLDYRYERLWQDTPEDRALMEKYDTRLKPGDIKIAYNDDDSSNDYKNRTVLGSPSPKWYGSLYNSIRFRNVELSFLFYARQKFMLDNGYFPPSTYRNSKNIDYWTPTNTGAYYPRPTDTTQPLHFQALQYEDASFVRLQYVSLAWSLPQKWVNSLKINQLKIYTTVQNPVLVTKFSQSDPEGAATLGAVPGNTTWLLGVRLEI